jgi:hypothetical protein
VTTGCSRFNHPELELEVGTLPEPLVAFLVRFVEERVAKGARFEVGQHLQIGSGLLRVDAAGERLTFLERVPGSDDTWERSVVRTLLAMYRQRCTLESVGMLDRLTYPAPYSFAMACTRVDEAAAVVFVRQDSEDGSGWAVLCADEDHDHDDADQLLATTVETLCERVELFEIFMAMPPGSLVIREGSRIVALDFNREPLELVDGSFLAKLRDEGAWPI